MIAKERTSARVQQLREKFLAHQPNIDPARAFFMDETGSTTAMARDHARSPRGERVHDEVPRNYGDVITVLGALTTAGLKALMTVRGGTTKEVFRTYVEEVLAPELREGDVVVLDNLAAHKDERAREIIEGRGAKLIFLPPYSPDLNPIEFAWSWVKSWLKTCRARTEDAVNSALCTAVDRLTNEIASGFVRHCGFTGRSQ